MTLKSTPASMISELRQTLDGEVLDDVVSRGIYATDASMYQMMPLAVVVPKHRGDLIAAVQICGRHQIPILPRGGGTSLTGQTVTRGVVVDTSKYLNRLLDVNVEQQWARVQPGLVRDELNALLKEHRLHFAPDPATSNRANIGGMIANNAAGMRSLQYGMTIDHLLELDVVLSTGDVLTLKELSEDEWSAKCEQTDREGEIYRGFQRIIEEQHDRILERYPRVARRSGGYSLDAFLQRPWNLARLMAASEGTLACILEAKVKLEPVPEHSGLLLVHFTSMGDCLRAVEPIVRHGPSAVELLDGVILEQARDNLLTRETCKMIEGSPAGVLVVEARGDDSDEVIKTLEEIAGDESIRQKSYASPLYTEAGDIQDVWLMRSSALGLLTTVPGSRKPVPYIEDAAVALDVLPDYIEEVLEICSRHEQPVSLFAHAGAGLLHIRPLHDLQNPEDVEQLKKIQRAVFQVVKKYKGSWSGEHGDGIVRGGFTKEFFGEELYDAFREVKDLFDPLGVMNPGKIIDTPPVDQHLRLGAEYQPTNPDALFHYRDFGGMREAVEICTGVGACRKTLSGTMCPSYMATRDEAHSTRGRANALRLALSGQLGDAGLSHDGLHEVLDLCLSCKGCKRECPNNVDLAKLKAETLRARHDAKGVPFRDRWFARSAQLPAGVKAQVINSMMKLSPVRWGLEKMLGVDRQRPLPEFPVETFTTWFRNRDVKNPEGSEVVLFADALTDYVPEVGKAAVKVLEAAGYRVHVERPVDSQRINLSLGLLCEAKKNGAQLFQALQPWAEKGIPILCCEPSCWSALVDDLPDLLDDEALVRSVSSRVVMIDTFLEQELSAGRIELPLHAPEENLHILIHGHCHRKALEGMESAINLLQRIPGAAVFESNAGCCGMAGMFGYQTSHYDLSKKIAQDRFLPQIVASSKQTRIVTNGFSCRHQAQDFSNWQPHHVVELLAECLLANTLVRSQITNLQNDETKEGKEK